MKYAILPQTLKSDELVGGNGLIEMGTFVAILLGEIVGGLVIAIKPDGPLYAGGTAIAIAIAGYVVSRGIPKAPSVAPDLRINWNPFTETWRNLRFAQGNRVVWLSMLGISWFWFYGATYLTQFANFTRDVLGGDEHVATMMLAIFSVGIGVGSLLCERHVGTQGRGRTGPVRLDRPFGIRDRSLFREPRSGTRQPHRRRRVPASRGALAHRRRPDPARDVRRFLHRAALCADSGALRSRVPVADHRRQQYSERVVHGRVGGDRARPAQGRLHHPTAVSGDRR